MLLHVLAQALLHHPLLRHQLSTHQMVVMSPLIPPPSCLACCCINSQRCRNCPFPAVTLSIALLLPLPIVIAPPSLTPFVSTSGPSHPLPLFMVVAVLHSAIAPPSHHPMHRHHHCPLQLCRRHCRIPLCCLLSAVAHQHCNCIAIPQSIALQLLLPIRIVLLPFLSPVATATVHGNCHNCAAFP